MPSTISVNSLRWRTGASPLATKLIVEPPRGGGHKSKLMVEPPRGEPALVETDLDSLDSEAAAVSVAPSTVADAIDAAIDAELSLAEAADLEEQERALENATGDGDGGAGHGGGGGGGDGDGDGDDRSVDDYSVISSLSAGTARPDPRWADPRGGGLAIPILTDTC